MSQQRSSLAVTYFDPESIPMPEQDDPVETETPKRRGRPPGSKNKPKVEKTIPWFAIWRAVFWAVVAAVSVISLYNGVEGLLGQSAANIVLAVSVLAAGYLLDRDWKKMRS